MIKPKQSIKGFLVDNRLPPMFSVKYAINCTEYVLKQKPTTDTKVLNALDLAKRYRDGDSTVTAQMLKNASTEVYDAFDDQSIYYTVHSTAYCAACAASNDTYAVEAASYAASYAAPDKIQWLILKDLINNEYSEVEQLILGLKI